METDKSFMYIIKYSLFVRFYCWGDDDEATT